MKVKGLIAFTAMVGLATLGQAQTEVGAIAEGSTGDENDFEALTGSESNEGVVEVVHEEAHHDKAEHHDEEHSESHMHAEEKYGYFGIPWAIPDFVVGIAMGAYGPINARTRDGDCFSKWYDWGVSAIELSNYFTKPFDSKDWQTWVGLVIKSLTLGS